MKNLKNLLPAAAILFLTAGGASAQLAKQNLTPRQITAEINKLKAKGDGEKAELAKEANALAAAKNENYNLLAADIYKYLKQDGEAEKITKGLTKKYPKGITARDQAWEVIEKDTTSIDEKLVAYNGLLTRFPKSSFQGMDQAHQRPLSYFSMGFEQAERPDDLFAFANKYFEPEKIEYFPYIDRITRYLMHKEHYTQALTLLEPAVTAFDAQGFGLHNTFIHEYYAEALIRTGKDIDKGIEVGERYIAETKTTINPEIMLALAIGYQKSGRKLDAFRTLEDYLIHTGPDTRMNKALEALYNELNGTKADYATSGYKAALHKKVIQSLKDKLKGEMVKKEAPGFTLQNMKGKTVSLSDYKGKIVIIDFWATWCVPCKNMFPAMQAAVNKYASDPGVVFLFIDVWEQGDSYKEQVKQFITKNKYTFDVLFDEMKEKQKATSTAYGIRSIPNKVLIDPEGYIRFLSSGGNPDIDHVVGEMEAKIELMREHK